MPNEGKFSIWVPFVSAVLGTIVGGIVQYYATRSLETQKHILDLQLSAYADLLKAQAAYHFAEVRSKAQDDANERIHEANIRIIVFSPVEVVESLAAFVKDKEHKSILPCSMPSSEFQMYRSMRQQALGGSASDIKDADIAMVFFACQP